METDTLKKQINNKWYVLRYCKKCEWFTYQEAHKGYFKCKCGNIN